MNDQIEKSKQKRLNAGKVGFILSLIALPTLFLSVLPSLYFCIMGIVRKKSVKFAIIGLLLNIVPLYVLLKITPPGSMPYPLNILKFKVNCPGDSFWLKYDSKIIDVQSCDIFFNDYGAVHFRSDADTYSINSVRKYAEEYGWVYDSIVILTKNDFEIFKDYRSKNGVPENYSLNMLTVLKVLFQSPVALQEDCIVLAFNTNKKYPDGRYIMISKDLSEMVVFINNPKRPDPPESFDVPNVFRELEKEQKTKEALLLNDKINK